jgi:hypothetical protein
VSEPRLSLVRRSLIPDDLIATVKAGTCVFLAGSGFSRSLGLPLWSDVADRICEQVKSRLPRHKWSLLSLFDTFQLPQLLIDLSGGSREPLNELLQDSVATPHRFDIQHRMLVRIPFPTVLTTNWDTAIEDAFEAAGVPVNVIYRDSQFHTWHENRGRQVIKIHGTISDMESIIIAHEDYLTYSAKHRALEHLLTTVLGTRPLLIAGFSLKDPNFDRILHQIKALLGDNRPPTFALFINEQEYLLDYWKNRGFSIIARRTRPGQAVSAALQEFFSDLGDATATVSFTTLERSTMLLREFNGCLPNARSGFVVRVRASLGPLASPKPHRTLRTYSNPDDDSIEAKLLDLTEWRVTQCACKLLDCGAELRVILCLDPNLQLKKYSPQQALSRLRTLERNLKKYGGVRAVVKYGELEQNYMIFGVRSSLESLKGGQENKLYSSAELISDANHVQRLVARFDGEFNQLFIANLHEAMALGFTEASESGIVHQFVQHRIANAISIVESAGGS